MTEEYDRLVKRTLTTRGTHNMQLTYAYYQESSIVGD